MHGQLLGITLFVGQRDRAHQNVDVRSRASDRSCRPSETFLRSGVPALLDGENLDVVVADQNNIARGFAE